MSSKRLQIRGELYAGVRLRALRDHQHVPAGAVLVVQKAEVDVLNVWYVALTWTDWQTRRRRRICLRQADLDDFEVVGREKKPVPPVQLPLEFGGSDIWVDSVD